MNVFFLKCVCVCVCVCINLFGWYGISAFNFMCIECNTMRVTYFSIDHHFWSPEKLSTLLFESQRGFEIKKTVFDGLSGQGLKEMLDEKVTLFGQATAAKKNLASLEGETRVLCYQVTVII